MSRDYNEVSPQDFVKILKTRVKKDWDAVVGITGEEGSSKSTLAGWLVYIGCIYDGLSEEESLIKFAEYTIFSPNKDKVQHQITKSARYSIVNADEAIKILYKQNWATPIQKFLNMFYALCRQENKISILCIPRFFDFNEFFRNHRIKFWIHIIDRGVGVIFERDWFPFTDDPWFIKDAQKMKYAMYHRKKTGDFNTEQRIQALSKLKNFIGVIRFDDLSKELKKVYLEGKKEFAYMDLEEQIKSGDISTGSRERRMRLKLVSAVKSLLNKGYNQTDVGKVLRLDRTTVRNYMKIDDDKEDVLPTIKNNQMEEDNFD